MTDPTSVPHTQRALPRGAHGLSRQVVEDSQRGRVLDAMTQAVAERGYLSLTVADVVLRAGVSRKTFYTYFADRQACFLAAYEEGMRSMRSEMTQAISTSADQDVVARLRVSVRSYLTFLAERPALARTFLLEVLAAGPEALERKARADEEYAALTQRWHLTARRAHPSFLPVPDAVYTAVVGAAHALVRDHVRRGQCSSLPELEPMLMYIHLSMLAPGESAERELLGATELATLLCLDPLPPQDPSSPS